jgi:hypothetical protein
MSNVRRFRSFRSVILALIEKLLHFKERECCLSPSRVQKTKNNRYQNLTVGDKEARCNPLVAGCKADELFSEVWDKQEHRDVAVKRGTVRCQSVNQPVITKKVLMRAE